MSKPLLCAALILACAGSAVAYNKPKVWLAVGAGAAVAVLAVRSKS